MPHYRSKIFLLIGLNICFVLISFGQTTNINSRQDYIDIFAKLAIQEMNEYHVPASITMAQACLESGNGNSELAREGNNHFGIKCNSSWSGPSIRKDDETRNECFRKYSTAIESFRDHSKFLTGGMRYQFLFDYKITDYRKWAYGLKKAGYATDPQYPERLIKIIEEFQLHKLDEYYNSTTAYVRPERLGSGAKSAGRHRGGAGIDNFSINPYTNRNVERRNNVKVFFAKEGDTYEQIAAEFSMKDWEIYKYNDVDKGAVLEAGSIVYLQTKRGSAPRGNDVHVMKEGESLWSVAQWYGVRLNALYRKNRINQGDILKPGQQISLRKKMSK
ncbi:MAG TPA: glucosaminidase domain-containing protein [Prolixibacteraceae bacterium]|nr:glucosaminidase domain-containing protein [Prolixibacteraceae bacterium]